MIHSLRGLLLLTTSVALACVLILGGMAIQAARGGAAAIEGVNDQAVAPMVLLTGIERRIKEVRFRIAGVALGQLPTVGSANHLKEVQAALPGDWTRFRDMARGAGLPEEEGKLLDKMDAGMGDLKSLMERLLAAYQNDDMGVVKGILEDDWPLIHGKLIKPMEQFIPHYQTVVDERFQAARQDIARMVWLVAALLAVALVLAGGVAWVLQRRLSSQLGAARQAVAAVTGFDLSGPIPVQGRDEISELLRSLSAMQDRLRDVVLKVREGAGSLESISGDLSSASGEVARASRHQAESATGMAASMEELSVSIDQMSEHARESDRLARSSGEAAQGGREITLGAAREMGRIAEGARATQDIVTELGQLSGEITSIVNVIKDIADQTNLLALNAAIEAARAGEQGRGFAVVADEVRKLAERTASSTVQISDMIKRIQDGTTRAVAAMEGGVQQANQGEEMARQAGASIDQIAQRAEAVMRSVNEIQNALQEQSSAARDVAARVEQIAQMTETNSSSSQQTSSMARDVSGLAAHLHELVAGFRV
ncbi:MAG: methyl-accepting chemotaxis protein [Pseudomonadota bacterium]